MFKLFQKFVLLEKESKPQEEDFDDVECKIDESEDEIEQALSVKEIIEINNKNHENALKQSPSFSFLEIDSADPFEKKELKHLLADEKDIITID